MTLVILSLTVEGCHNLFSLVTTSLININFHLEAQLLQTKQFMLSVFLCVSVTITGRKKTKNIMNTLSYT